MAASMVSDPESEQELAESLLMLKNNCLCFRMSSSFVGNNASLQIHSFSEDRRKCNKTSNPSISDFSTILMHAQEVFLTGVMTGIDFEDDLEPATSAQRRKVGE